MSTAGSTFEEKLERILTREVTHCSALVEVQQLSGGASQETYRLTICLKNTESVKSDDSLKGDGGAPNQYLALRRSPLGIEREVDAEHPGLGVEAELFQVAANAGVPEPIIHYVLQPADGLGEGIVMEWLEGESLGSRIVRSADLADVRPRLAFQCGEILARIHSIELAPSLRQQLAVVTPEAAVRLSWGSYQAFETPQPMIDFTARWLLDNLPDSVEPSLVHNDFRNGNLMVNASGIVGVLDWELAHLGDPMRDLGWLCVNSWRFGQIDLPVGGFGQRQDLFDGYESVSGRPVDPDLVNFWEVFGSFWWAANCLAMAAAHREGTNAGVERPAISRRTTECQIDCVNLLIPGPVAALVADSEVNSAELPRIDELLGSVRDFLRAEVMEETAGRTSFLARVAGNSLDIVLRDQALGPIARRSEKERLVSLLDQIEASSRRRHDQSDQERSTTRNEPSALSPVDRETRSLTDLRWELTLGLRSGAIELDAAELRQHLRSTVANQLAIDQPNYSGLARALSKNT